MSLSLDRVYMLNGTTSCALSDQLKQLPVTYLEHLEVPLKISTNTCKLEYEELERIRRLKSDSSRPEIN